MNLENTLIKDMPSSEKTFNPIGTIKEFNKSCAEIITRYEGNIECIRKRDGDTQDILHEIELSGAKNARDGYVLYKKLKLVREDRRRAKDENEILEPFVQWIKKNNKPVNNELAQVQGRCSTKQKQMENRIYHPRGDILNT